MKSCWLAWVILFLLAALDGYADLFDELATNKPATTNINFPSSFVPEAPIEALKAKAEKGDAKAQFELGKKFMETENAEAVKWLRKSADQGNADAQDVLGICYFDGKIVAQDSTDAITWFRKAAEQGNAPAQFNLGACYYYGHGVKQDYVEAVAWFRKAAAQGDDCAQNNLGGCYKQGRGMPQNYDEAVKWYRKAAEQGDAVAQYNLGLCYYNYVENNPEWVWGRAALIRTFAPHKRKQPQGL